MTPLRVLLAERQLRKLLAGGVAHDEIRRFFDLLAARNLADLEFRQLEKLLGQLGPVDGIVVIRLDDPAVGTRDDLELVAERDGGDLPDLEVREDAPSVQLGRTRL